MTDSDKDLDAYDTLEFCAGAISDAIYRKGGLDKATGKAVLKMIKREFEKAGKKFNVQEVDHG